MALSLPECRFSGTVAWQFQNARAFGNVVTSGSVQPVVAFADGTLVDQCDRIYLAQQSIAASSSLTIDLSALTDEFGGALAFARLKAIFVRLFRGAAADAVLVGEAAADSLVGWAVPLVRTANNDSFFELVRPDAVGWVIDSTHKNFRLQNTDPSLAQSCFLLLAGCSA